MSRNLDPIMAAWERHKLTDVHSAAISGGSESGALWSAFLSGWDARFDCDKAAPCLLAACQAIAGAYASNGNTRRQREAHALVRSAIAKATESK